MSFSENLQNKIEQRRLHGSSVTSTFETLKREALERVLPVHDALTAMVGRLAADPVFAAAFGSDPQVAFHWSADKIKSGGCAFRVSGPVGMLSVDCFHQAAFLKQPAGTHLRLSIFPDNDISKELGCGWCYGEATPVEGYMTDLDAFIAAVEDMLAEFLADVVDMPSGKKFLR